jgi:hypothetical protein
MKQKSRNGRKRNTPKSTLRPPDLEVAKSAVLNSLSCPTLSAATGTLLTNSWIGIAPNRGCRLAKPLFSVTECIWSHAN